MKGENLMQNNRSRKSKYNNKKTKIGNKTFDSVLEARYYRYLNKLVSIGEVVSFQCQVPYVVTDAFQKSGRSFKALRYYADFVVQYADGHEEIIDTKGTITDVFKLKYQLFEQRYPDKTIKLIKQASDKSWVTFDIK